MQDLRSALQFTIITIISRLLVYFIVRLIEAVKPRSAHFIISSQTEPAHSLRKPFPQRTHRYRKYCINRGRLVKNFLVTLHCYVILVLNRIHQSYRWVKQQVSLKLLTEVVGLITALISLLVVILNYYLN